MAETEIRQLTNVDVERMNADDILVIIQPCVNLSVRSICSDSCNLNRSLFIFYQLEYVLLCTLQRIAGYNNKQFCVLLYKNMRYIPMYNIVRRVPLNEF